MEQLLKKISWMLAICFPLVSGTDAGETRNFYGRWQPPPSLTGFWAPIDDSWWIVGRGVTPKLEQRCAEFAKRSQPEVIIPDIIRDLKANPSEVRWFVYLRVMLKWPRERVLRCLGHFENSRDHDIRHIAEEFYADTEDSH